MKNTDEEKFAPIDGFNDYLVTSYGRVFSIKNGKMIELKQRKNNCGYYYLNLYKNGKSHTKTIHRLVARAFIPNPENKPQVNHIDEDKANNNVSNLNWVTGKENINHGTCIERIRKSKTGKKHSEETIQKIIKSNKGKKRSEESKQKMSLNHADYKGKNNPKAKSVIGFKIDGCAIKYFKYIKECEKDGFTSQTISSCCKGKVKTHKGYKWYYADEFFIKKNKKIF